LKYKGNKKSEDRKKKKVNLNGEMLYRLVEDEKSSKSEEKKL